MKVELRKVKIARHLSEETTAFTADLWVDDKHIGYVKNSGHGGNNQVDHRFDGKGLNTRDEVRAFEEWCTKQPPHVSEYGELAMSDDLYISLLLEEIESERELKRLCKRKAVITLQGDPKGVWYTYNKPYTPELATYIRANEPKLDEILNERFI